VRCAIRIALERNRRHGDDWPLRKPSFEIVILCLAVSESSRLPGTVASGKNAFGFEAQWITDLTRATCLLVQILRESRHLRDTSRTSRARFVVIAGHIHNYERFFEDDIVYLVSGAGGAVPYEVDRTEPDFYQTSEFPNDRCVKITIGDSGLNG
jgi:hypothetical protein